MSASTAYPGPEGSASVVMRRLHATANELLGWRFGAALILLAALASASSTAHSAPPGGAAPNAWQMPALVLPDLQGRERRLADWTGRVILLNFWATWCPPCRYDIPDLIAYQARYGERGLQVIGIGLDEERKLRNFARSLDMNYPVLIADPRRDRHLLGDWGNRSGSLPYSLVIDRDGGIAYRRAGMFGDEELETYVFPLLEPKPAARPRTAPPTNPQQDAR
jgi:thiol-disulfide isomerase/thioredoxin